MQVLLPSAGWGATFSEALAGMLHHLSERLPFVVVGLGVVLVAWGIGRGLQAAACVAGRRTALDVNLANLLGKLVSGTMVVLGVLVASVVVFPTFRPGDLVAGLGITSIALGFAFKDILQNFFAGILILWRKPFRLGDEIRHGGFEGTVEDINVRSTRVRTYDGELAVLPNAEVYSNAVLVRTACAARRVRFVVGVGYGDSLDQARATITRTLTATPGVLPEPGPWVYVSELAPSAVNFTVYFWVEPRQANVLAVSDRVASAIKQALDAAHIDIPYPHTVVLFHNQSAQPETPGAVSL